jgi:hypothetical protein
MSMGEEACFNAMCNEAGDWAALEQGIWKTKDGYYINIKHMRFGHLVNCINALSEGKNEIQKAWIEKLSTELKRR